MQHFEQGFLGVVALSVATLLNAFYFPQNKLPLRFKQCLAWCLGILLGKMLLVFWFSSLDFHPTTRAAQFLILMPSLLSNFVADIQWAFWGGLGLGWLVLWFAPNLNQFFWLALIPLVLLPIVASDYTRVVSIATFPLLAQFVFLNQKTIEDFPLKIFSMLFLLYLVMPYSWFFKEPLNTQGFSKVMEYALKLF